MAIVGDPIIYCLKEVVEIWPLPPTLVLYPGTIVSSAAAGCPLADILVDSLGALFQVPQAVVGPGYASQPAGTWRNTVVLPK